jgi:hypothetical protein
MAGRAPKQINISAWASNEDDREDSAAANALNAELADSIAEITFISAPSKAEIAELLLIAKHYE